MLTTEEAAALYERIVSHLNSGGEVMVVNYAGGRRYNKASQFRLGKRSIYVARGKNWDCIDGCGIRYGTWKPVQAK